MNKDLKKHVEEVHKEARTNPMGLNMGREAFSRATAPVSLPAGLDNRSSILHPARALPGILDVKMGVRMSPVVQTNNFCLLDFSHLSLRIGNTRVIDLLHDRSCQVLKLEMFSEENLKTRVDYEKELVEVNKGTGKFHAEVVFEEMRHVKEALIAVDNYETLYSFLHPLCYAAKVIRRFVLVKSVNGGIMHSKEVARYFEAITMENGGRIARNEVPLTFNEMGPYWDQSALNSTRQVDLMATVKSLQKDIKDLKNLRFMGQPSHSQTFQN